MNKVSPENRLCTEEQAKPQLKVMIMLVTLISFYYHGCYLIISCSVLNGVVASATEHYRNYDDRVKIVLQPHHSSRSGEENRNHYYDDNQREHEHDANHHHFQKQQQQQSMPPQANDISTKLTHSQGRIDDEYNNYLDDTKDNSVTRDGGEFHPIDGSSGGFSSSSSITGDAKLQEDSLTSKLAVNNKKRYAFSATKIKAEKTDDGVVGDSETREKPAQQNRSSTGVSCKDELGNSVAWFVAYKLPQIPTSQDPLVQQGSKYYVLTANQKESWKESNYPIHSNQSILATTLQLLWENDSAPNIARVAYNDQPPSQPAVVMNGHTKGLIWTSKDEGVWLQHSCPHFPDLASQNFASSYPPGGLINGQMFLCMSLGSASSVDVVGSILQYTRPFVYNYSIPTTMENLIPELVKVAEKNATVRTAPWFNKYQLKAGELNLDVYAKGPKFRREIYSNWIAPEYDTGLDVQSWLNGAHPFMSNCTSSKDAVFNVLMKNISSHNFSNTDDHSKWAVSWNKDKPVACVGDLNRMKPQKTRGGVAICFNDPEIWSAFKSLVQDVQPCNSTSLKSLYALKLQKHHRGGRQ